MLTIEYVRETYPTEYWDLSDEEVQKVLDFFYKLWYVMLDKMCADREKNRKIHIKK